MVLFYTLKKNMEIKKIKKNSETHLLIDSIQKMKKNIGKEYKTRKKYEFRDE